MSATRTTKASVESGKREAILAAALDLFAERGFHGTAVPLVAERAKVGAGTVYRYFESKEALVNAVYQTWKGALASALLDGFPMQAPAREQHREFWRRMARFVDQHPRAFAFLELHHHRPYLDETSRAIENNIHVLARSFFEQAQKQEIVKPHPPELLAAITWGVFVGVVKGCREGFYDLDPKTLEAGENAAWEAIRR